MKKQRAYCDECTNFIDNSSKTIELGAKYNSKDYGCIFGKRVMFRMPKLIRETSMVAMNDWGWIRWCGDFEKNEKK